MKYILCTLIFSVNALALTLKEAESIALSNDAKLRGFGDFQRSLDAKKQGVTASLFPKLNASFTKTKVEPNTSKNEWTYEVRADFKNPLWHIAEHQSLNTEKKTIELENTTYKHALLYKIRTNYFKIKLLELQIDQSKQNLQTVSRVFERTQLKYKNGRIQVLDRDRAQVEVTKLEMTLASLQTDYEAQLSEFSKRIQQRGENLSTPLPETFKDLPDSILNKENVSVKKQKLEYEKTFSDLKRANADFLPNFFVAIQKNSVINAVEDVKYTAYVGGVVWNLSSSPYYDRKAILADRSAKQSNIAFEKQENELQLMNLLADHKSLLKEIKSQEAIVKTLANIAQQSLRQYEAGFVSLSDYSEDFRSLKFAQESLLNNRYKAVDLYARLAKILEEDSLFYESLIF